jgi:hypothetical protein
MSKSLTKSLELEKIHLIVQELDKVKECQDKMNDLKENYFTDEMKGSVL